MVSDKHTQIPTIPIIFSDLDGTLLSHDDYSFESAIPAIKKAQKKHIPIIFNTSKTRLESVSLAQEIGLNDPLIVENGGAIVVPENYDFSDYPLQSHNWRDGQRVISLGCSVAVIQSALRAADNELSVKGLYQAFSKMNIAEVQALTGLDETAAAKAQSREYSEPIIWHGNDEDLARLKSFLSNRGLSIIEGGRFHHVVGASNKCTAMVRLAQMYEHGAKESVGVVKIALGDSKNDEKMLGGADIAVVIKNDAGSGINIRHPDVLYTEQEGPDGWREAIDQILPRLANY
ncbi:MAG: HAD-IIB family hydrolase [Gammaproteobacteria bacterium]